MENVGDLNKGLNGEVRPLLDAARVLDGDVEPLREVLLGQPTVLPKLAYPPSHVWDDDPGIEFRHELDRLGKLDA